MSDELQPYPAADAAVSGVFQSLATLVYASDDFSAVHQAVVDAAPRLEGFAGFLRRLFEEVRRGA